MVFSYIKSIDNTNKIYVNKYIWSQENFRSHPWPHIAMDSHKKLGQWKHWPCKDTRPCHISSSHIKVWALTTIARLDYTIYSQHMHKLYLDMHSLQLYFIFLFIYIILSSYIYWLKHHKVLYSLIALVFQAKL